MAFIYQFMLRLAAVMNRQRSTVLAVRRSANSIAETDGGNGNAKPLLLLPLPLIADSMMSGPTESHVTLVCGTKHIHADHSILSTYSPFFESAFTKGWKETTSRQIELPGINPNSMCAILSYIYNHYLTEIIHDSNGMIILLRDSDFLQMDELVDSSFTIISNLHLNAAKFIEIIQCLEELGNRKCLSKATTFLAENFNKITESIDFLLLSASLLKDILQDSAIDKTCVDHVVTSILRWTEFDARRLPFLYDLLSFVHRWCPECLSNILYKNMCLKWTFEIINHLPVCLKVLQNNKAQCAETIACFMENEIDKTHVVGIINQDELSWKCKTMLHANYRVAVASYRHHLYLFGGNPSRSGAIKTSSCFVKYCPLTNTVLMTNDSLLLPVYRAGVGVFNHSIYIVNGLNDEAKCIKTVQCYNPRSGRCHVVASTNCGHLNPAVFSFKGALYIIGSITHDSNFMECFDCVCNQWTIITKIPTFCYQCCSTLCGNDLFVLNHVGETQFHVYDLDSHTWSLAYYHRGPQRPVSLVSIKTKNESKILAVDVNGNFHKYDIQSCNWSPSSVGSDSSATFYVVQVHLFAV